MNIDKEQLRDDMDEIVEFLSINDTEGETWTAWDRISMILETLDPPLELT